MSHQNINDGLKYTHDHEWISATPPYRIGISHFAQEQLGDLTFVELPRAGATLVKGGEFGDIESTKSASSLYSPVDATVAAVNAALEDDPGLVNTSPYGDGWLIEVTLADPSQLDALMDAAAYAAFLEKEGA